MKLKYYLRGLGVGVICTAIVMGIALSGNKKETLTDAEVIERARLLGMVMEEEKSDSGEDGSQQKESGKEETPEQNSVSVTPEKEKPQEKDAQEDKPLDKADKKDEEADGKADDKESGKQEDRGQPDSGNVVSQPSGSNQDVVEVEIKEGEYSDVISQKLFQAGLIPDAGKFNAYLTQKGVDDSLRIGVHLIPAGSTADEIIEILQGQQ